MAVGHTAVVHMIVDHIVVGHMADRSELGSEVDFVNCRTLQTHPSLPEESREGREKELEI